MILTEWAQRLTDPTPGEDEYLLQKYSFYKAWGSNFQNFVFFFLGIF